MVLHLKTKITQVGPEVAELAESGVLILFADGAPPELAEVSVLHLTEAGPSDAAPAIGASVRIGDLTAHVTAMGEKAWAKVCEIGHVVITFNGSDTAERPGEICATEVDGADLAAAARTGALILIGD